MPQNDRDEGMGKSGGSEVRRGEGEGGKEHFRATKCTRTWFASRLVSAATLCAARRMAGAFVGTRVIFIR